MPENFYHTLLGLDPEVVSPDYYQLLQMETATEFTAESIEEHYRQQITKTQKVTSPRYKNLIEFLKGELRTARTSLADEKLRKKYDGERKADAKAKLREIVIMFIQISGNLSDIEIGEIKRRGKVLNYAERDTDALIDELLIEFGLKRTQASPEQMRRASEILKKRGALSGAAAQVAASSAAASARVSGKSPAIKVEGLDVAAAAAGSQTAGTSGAKPKAGDVDLGAEADRLNREAAFRKKYAGYMKMARFGQIGLAGFGGLALLLVLVDVLGAGIIGPMFGGGAKDVAAAKEATKKVQAELATVKQAKDALQAEYNEKLGPQTPLKLAQAALGVSNLPEAERVAASDGSPEMLQFIQRQLMPAKLAFVPQWIWDFSVTQPDFRHAAFKPTPAGLQVDVTGKAVEWPFGGAFKCGIVEIEGEWQGKAGPFTLGFFQGNTDTPTVMGELSVDPAAPGRLDLNLLDETGAPLCPPNGVEWQGAAKAEKFVLRLIVTKNDLSPSALGTKIIGYYEQDGIRSAVVPDEAPRVSTTTQIERGNPSRREWIGASAIGRLSLNFKPGCKVLLKKIVVR